MVWWGEEEQGESFCILLSTLLVNVQQKLYCGDMFTIIGRLKPIIKSKTTIKTIKIKSLSQCSLLFI